VDAQQPTQELGGADTAGERDQHGGFPRVRAGSAPRIATAVSRRSRAGR
jgi:hypothetical protein